MTWYSEVLEKQIKDLKEHLSHATRFDFGNPLNPRDPVYIQKIGNPNGDYWAVKWGGSRWNKKHGLFLLEGQPSNRTDEFIQETSFTMEEAYELASGEDLTKRHYRKMEELDKEEDGQ